MWFPKHNISLSLAHNTHKNYYEPAASYLENLNGIDWESEEHKKRALETDEVWELQWYPDTPISSYHLAAPTFEELMAFAKTKFAECGAVNIFDEAKRLLALLTAKERKKLFDDYCHHCGIADPLCQCSNDL